MINNVVLVGRIAKDIELKYTSSGKAYLQNTIAVNRNFKNQNGEREADFIIFQVWGGSAEFLSNYARKGSLIGITGRIEVSSYDNEQGQKVYTTKVIADSVQLLESSNNNNQQTQQVAQQVTQQQQQAYQPQYNTNANINTNVPGFNNQPAQAPQGFENQAVQTAQDLFDEMPF